MDEDGWMMDGTFGGVPVHVTWDSDTLLQSDPPEFAAPLAELADQLGPIEATPTGPRVDPDLGDMTYAWLLVARLLDPEWVSNWRPSFGVPEGAIP